jgi:hypothetical protein
MLRNASRVQLKRDDTRWRTGGDIKGKLANGVVSTLHTTSEHGVSSITTVDAHTSAASSRLNWRPCRFKWTHRFRRKMKSGFCACAITFQTQSNTVPIKVTSLPIILNVNFFLSRQVEFFHVYLVMGSRYSDWLRTGWSGDRIPVGDEIFRTCPDRPWGPPSLLYNGYRVFPGG